MKIVAFLQNQWFKDPERIKGIIARTIEREQGKKTAEEIREYYIAAFLFMGCLTGRRLRNIFGEATEDIVWEECSREVGSRASSAFDADTDHMEEVLNRHQPEVVLVFGSIAKHGIQQVSSRFPKVHFIYGPHPAARGSSIVHKLSLMEAELRIKLSTGNST